MLYLAASFAWFLAAAAVLGLVMGWIARGAGARRLWNPAWTALLLLWGAGAALAGFQLVNGVAATWLESALLFVGLYWIACVAGSLASGFFRKAA